MQYRIFSQFDRHHRRLTLPALLCGLIALALPVSPQEVDNPLPHAGFEQVAEATGLPVGWESFSPLPQATVAYTLARARSGVASGLITDTSPTVAQGLRSSRVPITGGQTYEATVWVYIAECQAGGFALYLEYWQDKERLLNRSVVTSQVGDWVPLKLSVTAPEAATEATVLCYGSSVTVGEAYFDDASLRPVP